MVVILVGVFLVVYLLCFIYDVFFNGELVWLLKFLFYELLCYMKVLVEILVFFCLLVGMLLVYIVVLLLVVVVSVSFGG